jgi:integrase
MASSPIRKYEDISIFIELMRAKYGDVYADLVVISYQWGLRFQSAQQLRVSDARYCLRHGRVDLVESKTKKVRVCGLNNKVMEVFQRHLTVHRSDDEYLWGREVCRETYNIKLKVIGTMLGMDVSKLSSHSLRKTFAYQLRTKFGVSVQDISEQMGHSSTKITMIYAGLHDDELIKLHHVGL